MKFDVNRHYLYPVLRPHSDDYGKDASFLTSLAHNLSSHNVEVSIQYTVSDATIQEYVRSSEARCVAMLYCRDTMYRQLLKQNVPGDPFLLLESIPMRLLQNQVEVHPAIIAQNAFEFPTSTAHSEYGGIPVNLNKGHPLAVDNPWYFDVNSQQLKVDSLFKLVIDRQGELKNYEFDVAIDEKKRYVDIIVNEDTNESFRELRKIKNATIPTIYLSCLITLLSRFQEIDADNDLSAEDIPSVGWFRCIEQKLQHHNIDFGESDTGSSHTIMRAAQQLLTSDSLLRPFGRLFQLGLVDDVE